MANKNQQASVFELAGDTIVEVVRTKEGEETIKKEMTFTQWKNLKRQPGYNYAAYQKGYSQF